MLQRLIKGAHRAHGETSSSPARQNDVLILDNPNPPAVGRIDHHSVELFWDEISDTPKGDKRLKYSLEEEDKKSHEFSTVYIGYASSYKIEGLDPLQAYKYRLKICTSDGDISISPTITVCTTDEPYNSDHLHRATLKGDLDAITKIISSGEVSIDVNDKMGYTPLMNASQKGYLDVVDLLINSHADVSAENSSGKNSLMVACYAGHEAVVRRLREAGAGWECSDKGGSTPLHWAVDGGNCRLIEWMLGDGASVNVQDRASGWTPLMRCAAVTGNTKVAEILIAAGATVDAADADGKTALMIASLNGHLSLVEKLIESGADLKKKSGHGKTAVEMAHAFDRRPVVKYLEKILHQQKEGKASDKSSSTALDQ